MIEYKLISTMCLIVIDALATIIFIIPVFFVKAPLVLWLLIVVLTGIMLVGCIILTVIVLRGRYD
jgi:hypothetical protein